MYLCPEKRKITIMIAKDKYEPVHICHIIVKAPRIAFGADSAE